MGRKRKEPIKKELDNFQEFENETIEEVKEEVKEEVREISHYVVSSDFFYKGKQVIIGQRIEKDERLLRMNLIKPVYKE